MVCINHRRTNLDRRKVERFSGRGRTCGSEHSLDEQTMGQGLNKQQYYRDKWMEHYTLVLQILVGENRIHVYVLMSMNVR